MTGLNETSLTGRVPPNSSLEKQRRRKKKRSQQICVGNTFADLYKLTGEHLGEGSYGRVETCVNVYTGLQYAVKFIEKTPGLFSRSKLLEEIEIYHLCRGQQNIIQLIEYFEEDEQFYLIFEKIEGGPLLKQIQDKVCFTEQEASQIIRQLAEALKHLHDKGIAHRDIKPDNVLCVNSNSPFPVKLCDFDLCSQPLQVGACTTPTLLTPVGSLEYMAPEVADTFLWDEYSDCEDEEMDPIYNKKCDMWSLGILMYILLCGYAPFSGSCDTDCGWDRGESCHMCQENLFQNIKEEDILFRHEHWADVSNNAKDLIELLLTKDSSRRLSACQLLDHPWITLEGSIITLNTPVTLKKQQHNSVVEDFASRAMAINRTIEGDNASQSATATVPITIPLRKSSYSFDLSPTHLSNCSLLQRRRNIRENTNKFPCINELDIDIMMRSIY